MASSILEQIRLTGLVPVIAITNADDAEPLAGALLEGGLPCAEVTFRTAAAADAIRKIAKKYPDMLLGAGTVLSVEQVKKALDSGARYIVSPGLNPKVVEYCLGQSVAVTPGVATPSDLELALELGLEVVKFFPAEANGGLAYLKALSGPYGKVKFIPTGGIDETNLLSYLKFPKTLACGGSWMVKSELISSKQFGQIRDITSRAVQTMLGLNLQKLVLPGSRDADALAGVISNLLLQGARAGNSSIVVGSQFEVLKEEETPGTVLIGTHFLDRALYFLGRRGVKPREGGEKLVLADGTEAVKLDLHLGGLDAALVQR